ncbi:SDR family oxidoreductase [Allokutzneria albata]|uniref:NAD(P)-dependent dehydrogenase, short-chain alcohol dehydrogenase family n=1 Tax=Allokutzneria albata TaxID=211114 RepID=A0A1H0BNM8_ALLAB|nr:SDR family oxidoreductase [Allokutzneria albata]SDN47224.1 NAD(P)-dependent dehydrogenase, short-chain alcohol dehydrogenase family [Allokutzneria albata]
MMTARVVLVTGASRGVGAETARLLAASGAHVFVNYRDKAKRADRVVADIVEAGGSAEAVKADLTDPAAVTAMLDLVRDRCGRLDALVLNASGGMERDRDPGYAMRLNRDAQVRAVETALPLMPALSRVVFVTSHQAHFHGQRPGYASYEAVAASKRCGEDELRARIPVLSERGVGLVVVSGDMIEGTITVTLLDRAEPGIVNARRAEARSLPTVAEFAEAIARAAAEPVATGHTVYVGGADYLTPTG